jgi:hypothetical protein
LRQALQEHPTLWRVAGDLAAQARRHTINELDATPALRELVRYGLEAMQHELGYTDAPILERLVIDQVLLCWLRLNYAEYQYTSITHGEASWKVRDYWERRLSASQQRYTRAIDALVRVRKLARPMPLQVNIGGQQVIARR